MNYYITNNDVYAKCVYDEHLSGEETTLFSIVSGMETEIVINKGDLFTVEELEMESGNIKHSLTVNGEKGNATLGITGEESTCFVAEQSLISAISNSTEITAEQYNVLLKTKVAIIEAEQFADNLDYAVELVSPSDIYTDFKNIETVSEFLKLSYDISSSLNKVISLMDDFVADGKNREDFIAFAKETIADISNEYQNLMGEFNNLANEIINQGKDINMSYPQLNDYDGHGLNYLHGKYFEIAETNDAYEQPVAIYDIVKDEILDNGDKFGSLLLFDNEEQAREYAENNNIRILVDMHETVCELSDEEIKDIKDFDEYLSKSFVEAEDGHYMLLNIVEAQEEKRNKEMPAKETSSKTSKPKTERND